MDKWKKIMARRIAERAKKGAGKMWDATKKLAMSSVPTESLVGKMPYSDIRVGQPNMRKTAVLRQIKKRISQKKKGM
jgi:hypothetical protein